MPKIAQSKVTQFLLISLVFTAAAVAQTASAGAIQGTARDDSGSTISGATVTYRRIPRFTGPAGRAKLARGESLVSGIAAADEIGSYHLPALPTGDYRICGSVTSAAYLDPCRWGGAPRVTVSDGISASSSLVLRKGVFLNVSISDPGNLLLKSTTQFLGSGNLVVGVRYGKGGYLGTDRTTVTGTVRFYQTAIPTGTPLELWIYASGVSILDSNGKPLASPGAAIPFQAVAGQDQKFSFVVSAAATVQPVK